MWALPLSAFIIFVVNFYRRGFNTRLSFIYAAVLWGTTAVILVEFLSTFHLLFFIPLTIAWFLVVLMGLFYLKDHWRFSPIVFSWTIFNWTLTEKLLITLLFVIAAIKGASAFLSAPNTMDAMTYHLSRVEHWVQNGSVAHYPSHVVRQLYVPPWAEYAILNFRILSNADYFSNAVQWFSSIGSWIVVAGLAQKLGATRQAQLLSALLSAALPMGLVQATSTQTDYVLTFWVMGFVYLLWNIYEKSSIFSIIATGLCLGLGLLTKGTAYVYSLAPVLIFLGISLYQRDGRRLKALALIVGIAALLNVGHGVHNTMTFGKPYWTNMPLVNTTFSPGSILVNAKDNLKLHLGTPWQSINTALGVQSSTGEDDSGNFFYVLLVCMVVCVMVVHRSRWRKPLWVFAGLLILMVFLFCAIICYQPWNSRFHLSLFILSTPLVAVVLTDWLKRWSVGIGILALVLAWPWLLACNEHPFLGSRSIFKTSRLEQYFSERPDLILPYTLTMRVVESSGCREIGLMQGENDLEYPWWVLLHQGYGNQFRLEHVGVKNLTAPLKYPKGLFTPCLLITHDDRTVIPLEQGLYIRVWFIDLPQGLTSVFVRKN